MGSVDHLASVVKAGHADAVAIGGKHITIPLDSKNPLIMWKNVEKLAQVIDHFDVSIVHARSRAPAWSAWHAAHRTGKHFVTTFHSAYGHQTALKRLYNSVMTKGELVIAISNFVADHIVKTYKISRDKIRLIPRGVNTERFAREKVSLERNDTLRVLWRIRNGEPIIIMPGRLSRWKGQLVFIEAIAKLGRHDLNCLIVGSGDEIYKQELLAAIKKHGLEDVVRVVDECRDMPAAF